MLSNVWRIQDFCDGNRPCLPLPCVLTFTTQLKILLPSPQNREAREPCDSFSPRDKWHLEPFENGDRCYLCHPGNGALPETRWLHFCSVLEGGSQLVSLLLPGKTTCFFNREMRGAHRSRQLLSFLRNDPSQGVPPKTVRLVSVCGFSRRLCSLSIYRLSVALNESPCV